MVGSTLPRLYALTLIQIHRFKLHLRPETMKKEASPESELGALPLPDGKNVVEVLADFLHYLYDCARQFIIETHPNGESLWNSVEDHIEVILSHPNGWEGLQQSKMRDAAILACLVPDTTLGRQHVHFVTEGEASLHYCMNCGLATDAVRVSCEFTEAPITCSKPAAECVGRQVGDDHRRWRRYGRLEHLPFQDVGSSYRRGDYGCCL